MQYKMSNTNVTVDSNIVIDWLATIKFVCRKDLLLIFKLLLFLCQCNMSNDCDNCNGVSATTTIGKDLDIWN